MKIEFNHINYRAHIVVVTNPAKIKNVSQIKYIKNSKPKEGLLTKIMTAIIKPRLKNVLKTPS